MEWGALALAIVSLVTAIFDARRKSAPARQQAERERQYDDDVQRANAAIKDQDGAAIAQLFEQERQQAIQRGDLDPRGGAGEPGRLPERPAR